MRVLGYEVRMKVLRYKVRCCVRVRIHVKARLLRDGRGEGIPV